MVVYSEGYRPLISLNSLGSFSRYFDDFIIKCSSACEVNTCISLANFAIFVMIIFS